MDNVKNDAYYVKKIIKDIRFIVEKTEGVSLEEFEKNEVLCDSMLFRLIQISESSVKLTDTFKDKSKEIPWQAIKGMRNKIVHEYGEVDFSVVYQTITEDIPAVCKILENLTF